MYFRYVKMHIKSLAQYRTSFWLVTVSQFLVSCFYFATIYLLFSYFGSVSGWTFSEAALCFGISMFTFSVAECFARGFDMFSVMIRKGDYDRLLVRPRNTILQVFGSAFELSRIGRLVQSGAVLLYAVTQPEFRWDTPKIMTLQFMLCSGIVIFAGLMILGATLCFFTVEGLEIINMFTDGGKEIAQYPLSIYDKWVRRFFTFVIPFGTFNYLPLMYLTGRAGGNSLFYMLTPLAGFLFLIPCILIWRFGERHYLSTGS